MVILQKRIPFIVSQLSSRELVSVVVGMAKMQASWSDLNNKENHKEYKKEFNKENRESDGNDNRVFDKDNSRESKENRGSRENSGEISLLSRLNVLLYEMDDKAVGDVIWAVGGCV